MGRYQVSQGDYATITRLRRTRRTGITPLAKRSLFGNRTTYRISCGIRVNVPKFDEKDQCPPIESQPKPTPRDAGGDLIPVSKSRRHIQSPRAGRLVGPFPLSPRCERCLVFRLCGTGARSWCSFCRSNCRPSGRGGGTIQGNKGRRPWHARCERRSEKRDQTKAKGGQRERESERGKEREEAGSVRLLLLLLLLPRARRLSGRRGLGVKGAFLFSAAAAAAGIVDQKAQ